MNASAPMPGADALRVTFGTWPRALPGHVFVIGPAFMPALPVPFFAQPGILHRLDLSPVSDGCLKWQRGYLATEGVQVLRRLPPEARKDLNLLMLMGPVPNVANTGLCAIRDGRLLATFDLGRPVEVDVQRLHFLTSIGHVNEWQFRLPGAVQPAIATSAHPFWDPFEQRLYTVNSTSAPVGGTSLTWSELDLWLARWDGEGAVKRWHVRAPRMNHYVHEVVATRSFIAWIDSAVYPVEPGERWGLPRSHGQRPYTDVHIVRKRDLRDSAEDVVARRVRIPMEGVHVVADYDDDGEHLVLHLAHAGSTELTTVVGKDDVNHFTGRPVDPGVVGMFTILDAGALGRYRILVDRGEVLERAVLSDPATLWGQALFSRDPRPERLGRCGDLFMSYQGFDPAWVTERMVALYGAQEHRQVPVSQLPREPVPACLTRIDTGAPGGPVEHDRYTFAPGLVGGSPTYVPAAEGPGHVVLLVWSEQETELWLFDAGRLAAGPVAKAAFGVLLPLTLHSAWLPQLRLRTSRYHVDFAADIGEDHRLLPEPARSIVAQVIEESTRSRRDAQGGEADRGGPPSRT